MTKLLLSFPLKFDMYQLIHHYLSFVLRIPSTPVETEAVHTVLIFHVHAFIQGVQLSIQSFIGDLRPSAQKLHFYNKKFKHVSLKKKKMMCGLGNCIVNYLTLKCLV